MTVKDRILSFLDVRGLKKGDFFDAFGIAPSNFRGQSRLSGLNSDTIVKILTEYPELSAEWLLRGEGDMFISNQEPQTSESTFEGNTPEFLVEKIAKQAEEIGRLKQLVSQLERRRGDAGDVQTSSIASVG